MHCIINKSYVIKNSRSRCWNPAKRNASLPLSWKRRSVSLYGTNCSKFPVHRMNIVTLVALRPRSQNNCCFILLRGKITQSSNLNGVTDKHMKRLISKLLHALCCDFSHKDFGSKTLGYDRLALWVWDFRLGCPGPPGYCHNGVWPSGMEPLKTPTAC